VLCSLQGRHYVDSTILEGTFKLPRRNRNKGRPTWPLKARGVGAGGCIRNPSTAEPFTLVERDIAQMFRGLSPARNSTNAIRRSSTSSNAKLYRPWYLATKASKEIPWRSGMSRTLFGRPEVQAKSILLRRTVGRQHADLDKAESNVLRIPLINIFKNIPQARSLASFGQLFLAVPLRTQRPC